MPTNKHRSSNDIRKQFASEMSAMYCKEVPQYKALLSLVESTNQDEINSLPEQYSSTSSALLNVERHGAIRLGTAQELSTICRLFAVMGMYPVDYYDLSVAGIPVHSTAFRPTSTEDLAENPFRLFTSLLRLDLIHDKNLRQSAKAILSKRNFFSDALLSLIVTHEQQGGLNQEQSEIFIAEALNIFKWKPEAQVDSETYQKLSTNHRLIADVVSFKGPHINHLTPRTLNIDALQTQLSQNFNAKSIVEGPPYRKYPILLRQTSFIALEESVIFTDGKKGTHTARFGEVEQRGIALTPKGRNLYDRLLSSAKNNIKNKAKTTKNFDYKSILEKTFLEFPDDQRKLHDDGLAYFQYSVGSKADIQTLKKPLDLDQLIDAQQLIITAIIYEDFLPVSAAGIFTSNLLQDNNNDDNNKNNDDKNETETHITQSPNQTSFETALGRSVIDSFSWYEKIQQDSLNSALDELGVTLP